MVQLSTLYINSERHNAQCYRATDGRTDDIMVPIADHNSMIGQNHYFFLLRPSGSCFLELNFGKTVKTESNNVGNSLY